MIFSAFPRFFPDNQDHVMCNTTASASQASSNVDRVSLGDGMNTNTPNKHTEQLYVGDSRTPQRCIRYTNLLPYTIGRANSISAIRPLLVHGEQGVEMKSFEPCMNFPHSRTLGNAQIPMCYSMSSLNVRSGPFGYNSCDLSRHNNNPLRSEMTISEVVGTHGVQCRCQEVNKQTISQSAMTLCPVSLHGLGTGYINGNSGSYKSRLDLQSNGNAHNAGHQPVQSNPHTSSSERHRRYIRNRNPRILYLTNDYEGTWV